MRRISSLGYLLFALPLIAAAQQRGAAPPMMMAPMVRSVPLAVPAVHFAPAHPISPGQIAARPTGISGRPVAPHNNVRTTRPSAVQRSLRVRPGRGFVNPQTADDGAGVPGLGFDYVHYAAVHPNAHHSHFNSGFILPFVGGGIYVPFPYYMDSGAPAESAAENEPVESQEPAAETAERDAAPAASVRTRSTAIATPPQLSEFVFVRRDGTLFFAVAYSWSNDKLQYITQDGLRRMAPLDSLDLNATQQFNDQRGVTIRLPA